MRYWLPVSLRSAAWTMFWATLFAVSDEYHQSTVASRFSSVFDVGVDALDAGIGLVLAWWIRRHDSHH